MCINPTVPAVNQRAVYNHWKCKMNRGHRVRTDQSIEHLPHYKTLFPDIQGVTRKTETPVRCNAVQYSQFYSMS